MCKAGEYDSHQHANFKFIYGDDWGDDTVALSYLNDIGIFLTPFGAWTELEMMLFTSQNRGCYIYDSYQEGGTPILSGDTYVVACAGELYNIPRIREVDEIGVLVMDQLARGI